MTATLNILADIGGTNTRVALADGTAVRRASIRRFANAEHPGLDAVLKAYLGDAGGPAPAGACVAVAGPVDGDTARMTNLNWTIDRAEVARATGAGNVAVLNDLQAQGHAIGHIDPTSLRVVLPGRDRARKGAAPRLVIGAGTGFNAACVHDAPGGRIVTASECGHTTLPARNEDDLRLIRFADRDGGFVGVEEILAGRGLTRLFAWHASEAGRDDRPDAAAIMEAVGEGRDPVALATAKSYCTILGRVVGDLALIHLPFGGIYLIGGVARAFTPHLDRFGFADAYRDKGRFAGFMDDFRISIIEDDYAALVGCAVFLQSRAGTGAA